MEIASNYHYRFDSCSIIYTYIKYKFYNATHDTEHLSFKMLLSSGTAESTINSPVDFLFSIVVVFLLPLSLLLKNEQMIVERCLVYYSEEQGSFWRDRHGAVPILHSTFLKHQVFIYLKLAIRY